MPLNWTSSRTIWVKREAWDLVESARAAKSAMATRGLLVSPSPVPARNHPWDCPNAAWAENAKIVRSGRRCFRLRTTCTLELGWTNGIRTLNRFFSFMDPSRKIVKEMTQCRVCELRTDGSRKSTFQLGATRRLAAAMYQPYRVEKSLFPWPGTVLPGEPLPGV